MSSLDWKLHSVFAPLPHVERGYASVISGNQEANTMIYCNGRAIVKRDLSNPYRCEAVFLHNCQASVAK